MVGWYCYSNWNGLFNFSNYVQIIGICIFIATDTHQASAIDRLKGYSASHSPHPLLSGN